MIDVNEKLKQDAKLAELKKRNQDEYNKVKGALQIICGDPNVQIVFRHLAVKLCGFFKSSVVVNPTTNDIALNSTAYNEGRRSVYLDLRRMMNDVARRVIESKGEEDHGGST